MKMKEREFLENGFKSIYRLYKNDILSQYVGSALFLSDEDRWFRIDHLKKYDREGFDPERWYYAFKVMFDKEFSKWSFTKAEKEVGGLLLTGLAQEDIAEIRKTSLKTVKNQTTVIYEKAQVKNGKELMSYFIQKLLPSSDEGLKDGKISNA
jgi:DNA-binding CsgD family transcriptional regulator